MAGKTTEAQRLADVLEHYGRTSLRNDDPARRDAEAAAALLREQAAELERLRAQHDECPLWPAEDGR